MTPSENKLAGAAALVVAIAGISTWWFLGQAAADQEATTTAVKTLSTLPASPQEVASLENAAKAQETELAQVVTLVAPPLKPEYLVNDAVSAAARVRSDLVAVRTRAESAKIALPGSLPFETGLDPDDAVRSLQLAHLALLRTTLDSLLDAGVAKVNAVSPGRSWLAPVATGSKNPLAALSAELDLEFEPEALGSWLKALAEGRPAGLTLRAVQIEPAKAVKEVQLRKVKATVVLLTQARPEWRLIPEAITAGTMVPGAASTIAPPARGLGSSKRVGQ